MSKIDETLQIVSGLNFLVHVGERLSVVETHCMGLRMLYRDCARPPPPKVEKNQKEVSWKKLEEPVLSNFVCTMRQHFFVWNVHVHLILFCNRILNFLKE